MTSTLFKAFPLRKRASKPSSTSAYGKKTILERNFFITMDFLSFCTVYLKTICYQAHFKASSFQMINRKLAKFLDPKNLYNPAMCIHVLITSYNLIVGGGKDQLRLQRVKWHYMILDEAQAVKNCASRRWKTLL